MIGKIVTSDSDMEIVIFNLERMSTTPHCQPLRIGYPVGAERVCTRTRAHMHTHPGLVSKTAHTELLERPGGNSVLGSEEAARSGDHG